MKINDENSGYTWPSRVREYDDIPNRRTSKEESWRKIRERLDQAPKRKNRSWYWLAAASVILFVVILLNMPVHNRTVRPGYVKTPAVLKQDNHAPVTVDTIKAALITPVKSSNPGIKKAYPVPADSLQVAGTKKESVVPLPGDSLFKDVRDTGALADDLAQHPTPLPKVHINDLNNAEPLPAHITIQSLAVKKLIRLFSIDFTKEQPYKKGARHPNQNTIPEESN
ncbi:MAG: hypothetical protein ABI402_07795 [Ferruginibacter sp.]